MSDSSLVTSLHGLNVDIESFFLSMFTLPLHERNKWLKECPSHPHSLHGVEQKLSEIQTFVSYIYVTGKYGV